MVAQSLPRPSVRQPSRRLPTALATIALAAFSAFAFAGCEKRLEQAECDQIRGEAFEMLNKGQPCSNDSDCRQSEWPGCEKPVSNKTHEALGPLQAKFTEGKCEEKRIECRKPPPVYCKQGLCVTREPGIPEMRDDGFKVN